MKSMTKSHAKTVARASFQFPGRAVRRLAEIRRNSSGRLNTDTLILSEALRVFDLLATYVLSGMQLVIVSKNCQRWIYDLYTPPRDYPPFAAILVDADDDDDKSERKTFGLSDVDLERIEHIHNITEYTDRADVVRISLGVLLEVTGVLAAGDFIIIRDQNGYERPFVALAPSPRKFELFVPPSTPSTPASASVEVANAMADAQAAREARRASVST